MGEGVTRSGSSRGRDVAESNRSDGPSPEQWAEVGRFVAAHPELSLAAVARRFEVGYAALCYRCRRFGWRPPAGGGKSKTRISARSKPAPPAPEGRPAADPELVAAEGPVTARVLIDAARQAVFEALRDGPPGELAVLAKTAAEVARITAQAETLVRPGDKDGSEVEALESLLRSQPEVLDLVEGFLERIIGGGGPDSVPDVHDPSGTGPVETGASSGRPVPGPAEGGRDP
jgi:hypothetical protein